MDIPHVLYVHWLINTVLALVIINNATVNSHVHILYEHMFSILLDVGVRLLGRLLILCLTFERTAKLFSVTAALLCTPTSSVGVFQILYLIHTVLFFFGKILVIQMCVK